jgi:predicted nucleic acid-binding protein
MLLNGDEVLSQLCDDSELCISIVSEMELKEYIPNDDEELSVIHRFLGELTILGLTDEITKITSALQTKYNMLLPDCLLAATAISNNCPLITADNQFKKVTELNLVFYELSV